MQKRLTIYHSLKTALLLLMSVLLLLNMPSAANASPQFTAHPENTWGQFVVKAVHNLDSTDVKTVQSTNIADSESELFRDYISLGATMLSKHGVDMIEHRELGYFYEGQSKYYQDWVLAEVPVEDLNDFARVTLSLVEVDLGGKERILAKIAEEENRIARENLLVAAQEQIDAMATNAVSAAGIEPSTADEELAVLFGLVVIYVSVIVAVSFVSVVWTSIAQLFGDDAFTLEYVEIPDDHRTESGTVIFIDHGGQYRLDYEWRWIEKDTGKNTGKNAEKGTVNAAQADGIPTDAYNPIYSFADLNEQIRQMWADAQGQAASQTNKLFIPAIATE